MYIFFFVKQQLLFMPFCLLYKNKIFQKNEKVYMFFVVKFLLNTSYLPLFYLQLLVNYHFAMFYCFKSYYLTIYQKNYCKT